MKKNLVLIILAFFLFIATNVTAQEKDGLPMESNVETPGRNMIKVNVTSLALKNFSLQYERAIARKISVGLGVRYMPEGSLPFKSIAKDYLKTDGLDDDITKQIDNFRLGNFALTPEMRFYMGKEVFRGFYIAPFARYATFNVNFPFILKGTDTNNQPTSERIDLIGNLNTIAGGILFGAQWKLGKQIYLDWSIMGPHYGKATGIITGKKNLTQEEQDELRSQLANLDIPFVKFESKVDANGAEVKVDGPWAGIRAGISIGFRF